jgi:ferrochelatase
VVFIFIDEDIMRGVLLVNVGSPESTSRKDVRFFIEAMLSDPLLMTVPDWFRPILVKGIIGPFRQFASAKHYSLIWDEEHKMSPLMYHMKQLAEKLTARVEIPVEVAMRYGQPDITSALQRLAENDNLHEVVVLPLFPHYAESSYKTVVDEVGRCFYKKSYDFRLKIIEPYFNHMAYIRALTKRLEPFMSQDYDRLMFCFHSLPLSHVEKGWKKGREFDYVYQLKETALLVSKELKIEPNKYRVVYTSAMGNKWLGPDINETLKEMAQEGIKNILAISPGFACDNLETLYDVRLKARETFVENGGKQLSYVPCLNSEDYWVDSILEIIS